MPLLWSAFPTRRRWCLKRFVSCGIISDTILTLQGFPGTVGSTGGWNGDRDGYGKRRTPIALVTFLGCRRGLRAAHSEVSEMSEGGNLFVMCRHASFAPLTRPTCPKDNTYIL
jgi:hypothetical protein